ncbi:hypothetical protein BS78_K274300 [Paspalum vaginatum]|uniref:Uncharacterized protein n=1 Tax=Paspalum vaginatum TaxID=158149 RepID=A0A9W7XAV3_9POAL|nr:hypothetical protein BS78_K274300 [Paspalum vaginatum]
MLGRMRCLVGGGVQDSPRAAAKRVSPASWRADAAAGEGAEGKGPAICLRPPDVMETVHEVAIYIHRFHNLDLFQQGWYQMKISAMWEEGGHKTPASPARVVQYEGSSSFGCDVEVELIYAPTLDNGSELQASSVASSAAVHEFRIPRRALLVYLKAGATKSSLKVPDQGLGPTSYHIVKALLTSRKTLLEEREKISGAVGKTIEDLDGTDLSLVSWNFTRLLERPNDMVNVNFHFYDAFLKFHRINKTKILDYLHDVWAIDRKAEWSIWTVHSKIEIPHRYLRSTSDDSSRHSILRVSGSRKFHDDPVQNSASGLNYTGKHSTDEVITQSVQICIYMPILHVFLLSYRTTCDGVPQHGSSKDLASNAEQKETIVLPKLQGESLAPKVVLVKKVDAFCELSFCAWFQGHHLDLRLVRNQWLLLDPGADCLMSEANEDKNPETSKKG